MIKEITSIQNEYIKYLLKLKNPSFSKKEGVILFEGEHLIKEGKDDIIAILFNNEKYNFEGNFIKYKVSENILAKLSFGKSKARVIGVYKFKEKKLKNNEPIVYLDNIQDPGNVGTILRTSLAFDFKNIVISNNSASIFNEKVIQASQGAIFKLNINFGDFKTILNLKNEGYKIISTSLNSSSILLENFNINERKYVLIFGNEGNGVSKEILDISNTFLKINISNIDSLNVGVAVGIILNHLK